jgi:hypothetical protein
MNEYELRQAMRATMSTTAAPPPMSESMVLDVARQDLRRRRTRLAGAGSAAAAVAVIGIAVAIVATTSGAGAPGGKAPVGAPPTGSSSGQPTGSSSGQPSDTKTSWPNGQTDRTASSGSEYEQGRALLDELVEAVPAGFGAPGDLTYGDPQYSGGPLQHSQAQYEDTVDGTEVWEYDATQPVTKGGGVGKLMVQVTSPDSRVSGEGCDLPPLWGEQATCVERVVDGKTVGVFTTTDTGPLKRLDGFAGYRHEDGTVVFVAQAAEYAGSGKPALAGAPLSPERLAQLATDPRFGLH